MNATTTTTTTMAAARPSRAGFHLTGLAVARRPETRPHAWRSLRQAWTKASEHR